MERRTYSSGSRGAQIGGLGQRESLRDVAIERIVGTGLIGHDVDVHAAAHDFRQDVGAIAHQAYGQGTLLAPRRFTERQGFVEILGELVAIASVDAALDAGAVDVDGQNHAAIQRDRQWLRAAHAAHAAGDDELAGEGSAEVALGERGEGLERALQDALRADVDPASRGHLAVHHQALAVEFVKVLPVGPFADKIRVGNDHARGHVVGGKDGHGLAGLDQKGFIVAEMFEFAHDGVKAFPVARGAADAAVDDQVGGALGHVGIEVVHQAAQSGFLLPALAAELIAAGGTDHGDGGNTHGSSCWGKRNPSVSKSETWGTPCTARRSDTYDTIIDGKVPVSNPQSHIEPSRYR